MPDVVYKGRLVTTDGIIDGAVAIEDGKIVDMGSTVSGKSVVDVGNQLILPAAVDVHVHFRDPGFPEKEDFFSGSVAAAFGGVGCVVDMPNTMPPTISLEELKRKRRIVAEKSVVDAGVYVGVTNENIGDLGELSEMCAGFKVFLGSSTGNLLFDINRLDELAECVSGLGLPVLVHAESEGFLQKFSRNEENLMDHLAARPSVCEVSAVNAVMDVFGGRDVAVHVCHLSSAEGLEVLRNRPGNISVGVTPHHTWLNVESTLGNPNYGKVNPPLRFGYDQQMIWGGLVDGRVEMMESDHAPHAMDEKCGEFGGVPSGMPGVETWFPLLLAQAVHGKISWERVIEVACVNPARLLGVKKGVLDVGFDADLVIVDPARIAPLDVGVLHSKCGWSAFEGMDVVFPSRVVVRGTDVVKEGELLVDEGFGKVL